MAAFADRYPVAGFLASMGLPQDDADFFVSIVHRMSGATGGDAYAVDQMNNAWGELAAYWADMLADRRRHPLDPTVDFVTMMSQSKLNDDPMPDRGHPRHHGHADARQPRHAEEPARLADVAPGHPPRGPPAPGRRAGADPQRGGGVPPGLPDRVDGPQGHPGRRLPRLPDEEGRHGPAHASRRRPATRGCSRSPRRCSSTAARTGTSPSVPASTAASARTSRAPTCSLAIEEWLRLIPEFRGGHRRAAAGQGRPGLPARAAARVADALTRR